MAKKSVEKVRVLADVGFDGKEAVDVNGVAGLPRDLII